MCFLIEYTSTANISAKPNKAVHLQVPACYLYSSSVYYAGTSLHQLEVECGRRDIRRYAEVGQWRRGWRVNYPVGRISVRLYLSLSERNHADCHVLRNAASVSPCSWNLVSKPNKKNNKCRAQLKSILGVHYYQTKYTTHPHTTKSTKGNYSQTF